jgi:hypothetical protein
MVVAAAIALVPVLAMASNQEFAEKIAASLRDSGQLQDYKVGVKFQDGTAWLRGRVTSQEQMNVALRHVLQIPGVLRVVNNLEVAGEEQGADPAPMETGTPLALRQTGGALGSESSPRLASPGPMAQRSGVVSQTAARLEKAASEAGQVRHPVDVVSATSPMAGGETNRLASSFVAAPVQPTMATASGPAAVRPASRASAASASEPPMVAMSQPTGAPMPISGGPIPQYITPASGGMPPAQYDQPNVPNYAWPSYASYPNYAALTYPKQYSPTAWPYIGPFYPYPQVPLGWRSVKLQWHDGWWQLDFDDGPRNQWFSGLFRPAQ